MSIFEAAMMLGFGLAWPFNIYKSVKSRSSQGKSLGFLLIIETAYLCGIIHKVLYSRDIVLVLYALNFLMVMADLVLFFVNRRRERRALPTQPAPAQAV